MDAAELYGIVKDVPKEAWPEFDGAGIHWCGGWWHGDTAGVPSGLTVLVFEACLSRWLDEKFPGDWYCEGHRDSWRVWKVGDFGAGNHWASDGKSKLEALAAACKALAPTPTQRT